MASNRRTRRVVSGGVVAFYDFTRWPLSSWPGQFTSATTTLGTEFSMDGVLRYAPHNKRIYSQDISNASWSKTGVTINADATAAPDGTLTADLFKEDTSTGGHHVQPVTTTVVSGDTVTVSYYVKAAGRTIIRFYAYTFNNYTVFFSTDTGAFSSASGGTAVSATASDAGSGWWRLEFTDTTTSTNMNFVASLVSTGTTTSYAGDNSSGMYFWGCQVETNPSASYYVATTSAVAYGPRKHVVYDGDQWPEMNLALYSDDLSNAAWTKSGTTIAVNQAVGRDGLLTLDRVREAAGTGAHWVLHDTTVVNGSPIVMSGVVKGWNRDWAFLEIYSSGGTGQQYLSINLTDGSYSEAVAGGGAFIASSVTDLGGGLYEWSATVTASSATMRLIASPAESDGTGRPTFAGDTGKGIYMGGLQIEQANAGQTAPNPYHATTSAAYFGAIPNSPWLDKGLLVEGAIAYERVGNGDLSSNWGGAAQHSTGADMDGVTRNIVLTDSSASSAQSANLERAVANDGATNTVGFRVPVTTNASTFPVLYMRFYAGSPELTSYIAINTDTGVMTDSNGTPASTTYSSTREGNNWNITASATNNSAGNTGFQIRLFPAWSSDGTTLDNSAQGSNKFMHFNLIFNQSFEVSPLLVDYASSGATTRSADRISIATSSINGFSATEGSLVTAFTSAPVSLSSPQPFAISDGSSSNRIEVYLAASGANYNSTFRVTDGGVTQVSDGYAGTFTPGAAAKIAVAWKTNDFAHSRNGGAAEGDTSGTVPTGLTAIYLGADSVGNASFLSGSIQSITYYPRRLSDDALVDLTS